MELSFEMRMAIAIALGLLPAAIAHRKGFNFFLWWILGTLAFIVVLPIVLLVKPIGFGPSRKETDSPVLETPPEVYEKRPCPHCGEPIKLDAKFCRFCHLEVPVGT